MAELKRPSIDAPIAGMSLTTELGNRPWEQPPQYTTVEEALEFYIPRIMEPTFRDDLLNVMEMGVPITTIANALQSGAVMEGKHTLDVGVLVTPVLMEMLAFVADREGIEYRMGTELDTDESPLTESSIALAKKRLIERQEAEKKKPAKPVAEEMPAMETETTTPATGLMARR